MGGDRQGIVRRILTAIFLVGSGMVALGADEPAPGRNFTPPWVENGTLRVVPESERHLHRMIIGLGVNETRTFMVPKSMPYDPKTMDPRIRAVRRELYWIHTELRMGNIMKMMPPHTRFFVAVPDPKTTPSSAGNESVRFGDYLKKRAGWTDEDIKKRINFFQVPEPVSFTQDIGEPLGGDPTKRLVLGIGSDNDAVYQRAVEILCRQYPQDFVFRNMEGINTEGGDVELVWMPEGKPGVLVGYHRIRRFQEAKLGRSLQGGGMQRAQIDEARNAFKKSFFGLETFILGEENLREPGLASEELFHADMMVNIVRSQREILAFIPSFIDGAYDTAGFQDLSPALRSKAQRSYDLAARQLEKRGYRVVRLPLADHPVRSPVNVGKYIDMVTGRQVVLLGKYPDHLSAKAADSEQERIQNALLAMESALTEWRNRPDDKAWAGWEKAVAAVWAEFDRAEKAENPVFERQAQIYRNNGIDVVPVTVYPTSEGGLHCLILK